MPQHPQKKVIWVWNDMKVNGGLNYNTKISSDVSLLQSGELNQNCFILSVFTC